MDSHAYPEHGSALPRRILALDGGGVRGVFTIEVLAQIEELLRQRLKNPNLVLAEHFHFVAGTSTGAIIAALLSWGEPISRIRDQYATKSAEIFLKQPLWKCWSAFHDEQTLSQFLRDTFKDPDTGEDALLRTKKLRTLLMLCMRNATTGSAWPITNNPTALFNQGDSSLSGMECNLNIPLWQLIRASTAAPAYFRPESITMNKKTNFAFVDGATTAYNNPALIAVLTAILPCYRMEWPSGRNRIHLTSIGTIRIPEKMKDHALDDSEFANTSNFVPEIANAARASALALIDNTSVQQDMLCRLLGDCVFGADIDMEVGSLISEGILTNTEKKFSYVRYNKKIEKDEVMRAHELGGLKINNSRLIPLLAEIGRAYAEKTVRLEHLLGYSIGFSGHRRIPESERIERIIRHELLWLMGHLRGTISCISSIAAGADTLFASQAIALNIPWTALLPFPREEFAKDFEGGEWERALECLGYAAHERLVQGSITRPDAYYLTGIQTVDESDIMLVVWDGKPAAGRGGTAEMVDYTRQSRKPLIWVKSETGDVIRECFESIMVRR